MQPLRCDIVRDYEHQAIGGAVLKPNWELKHNS